ncbi:MAG: hypothetical protein H6707_08510 [Deltaproteobacteria bacterium]|nr:hypothetical protein [Deltaproteobacteria bacterium]
MTNRTPSYRGQTGRTQKRAASICCVGCNEVFSAQLVVAINAVDDRALSNALLEGRLNRLDCPTCAEQTVVEPDLLYHDPAKQLMVVVVPSNARHRALQAQIAALSAIEQDGVDVPQYVRQLAVAFGAAELASLLEDAAAAAASASADAGVLLLSEQLEEREAGVRAREEELAGKQADLAHREQALESRQRELDRLRAELEKEREAVRGLSVDLAAQHDALKASRRQPPPLPPAAAPAKTTVSARPRPAELAAWIKKGDGGTALFDVDGQLVLLARGAAAAFRDSEPEVLIQLHRLDRGRAVTILLRAQGQPGAGEPAPPVLRWYLDPQQDRPKLELLAERCELTVELLSAKGDKSEATWDLAAPLASNVRLMLDEISAEEDHLGDYAATVHALAALDDSELLGKKAHNFSEDSFSELPSPASARLALGIVSYWSEPDNERYLLLTKSFPARFWNALRDRVTRSACAFGLRLDPRLAELALRDGLAADQAELLRRSVANFAEVSLRIVPSDLDPLEEWENWRLLLDDCLKAKIEVEPQIAEVAAAASRRAHRAQAPIIDEAGPGGDLTKLSEKELIALLGHPDQRRDAALELCTRGNAEVARPIFRAVGAMSRAEVVRVLPAMTQLGTQVSALFVEGLRHRKSFVRQGSALALGVLRDPAALRPLCEMLITEPTRVWIEGARALGSGGDGAVDLIRAQAEIADGDGRERLAWAFAHYALTAKGRRRVEDLARGAEKDSHAGRVAARALQMLARVRQMDAEVRGQSPLRDQTIVRHFSRRFFEHVAGEVAELTEADIVDQEEVLEDGDIVEEAVEVSDDDILETPIRG